MKVQEKNKNLRGVSVRHVNYAIMGLYRKKKAYGAADRV